VGTIAIAEREKKKMGRPATGRGRTIGVRVHPELDAALDAWISRQPEPELSKPEAIRRLVSEALGRSALNP
jgi:hypothetical protein